MEHNDTDAPSQPKRAKVESPLLVSDYDVLGAIKPALLEKALPGQYHKLPIFVCSNNNEWENFPETLRASIPKERKLQVVTLDFTNCLKVNAFFSIAKVLVHAGFSVNTRSNPNSIVSPSNLLLDYWDDCQKKDDWLTFMCVGLESLEDSHFYALIEALHCLLRPPTALSSLCLLLENPSKLSWACGYFHDHARSLSNSNCKFERTRYGPGAPSCLCGV
jgi:hypothetical protein